jgi:hypothetical protein
MWIFGGAKTKLKAISGASATHLCTDCNRITSHRPVAIKDKFHVFFIAVGTVESQGYACVDCGEVVESSKIVMPATQLESLSASGEASGADAIRTIAQLSQSATMNKRIAVASVDHSQIEKELAALKAKK